MVDNTTYRQLHDFLGAEDASKAVESVETADSTETNIARFTFSSLDTFSAEFRKAVEEQYKAWNSRNGEELSQAAANTATQRKPSFWSKFMSRSSANSPVQTGPKFGRNR